MIKSQGSQRSQRSQESQFSLYTDGGARGNPGPGAVGVIIKENSKIVKKISKFIGKTTNNQAEYQALILGLGELHKLTKGFVQCFLDSELIVKQLKGEYKVKDKKLIPLYNKVRELAQRFKEVKFVHIPRFRNKEADRMVNEELNRRLE